MGIQLVLEVTCHLSMAFDLKQLPLVPLLQEAATKLRAGTASPDEGLRLKPALLQRWLRNAIRDMYLAWVQATLLKVVKEVLGRADLG
jgi:hypothetical protein